MDSISKTPFQYEIQKTIRSLIVAKVKDWEIMQRNASKREIYPPC